MRPTIGHRSAIAGSQGRRGGEEGSYVQEQRSTPVAVRYSGPTRSWCEKVLRQVLRRLYRSYQYSAATVYLTESCSNSWRRVPRERELRFPDSTAG